jgi:hypothetical protein
MNSRLKFSRYAYAAAARLVVIGILTQVFLIGLSLLGRQPSWQAHVGLGHGLAGLVLLMIVLAYTGWLPRRMKSLTWLALAIYVLLADVVIFMRASSPLVAALHPVLAVLLFWVSGHLALHAWRLVREPANLAISPVAAEAIED